MKKIKIKGPIVNNDTAWLYDWIGWDCASPKKIEKGLEEAGGEDVVLEINSPGGIVAQGYEMYTSIMEYTGKVTANVICACSAATLLVCAATEALISDTGIFMIHNAQSRASGDYRDLQMESNALKEIDEGIINAYVRKTGMKREDLQELMDKDTYMSPQTAIQYGFIDGYMFGDPNGKGSAEVVNFISSVAAADTPIIPEEKAKELMAAIHNLEIGSVAPMQQGEDLQNTSRDAVSDKNQENQDKEGETKMTLSEFLAENPESQEEVDAMVSQAKEEGQQEERKRMQSLDAISATVTKEALNAAKYGEKPIDGPTLAYQAMVEGKRTAAAYMADAQDDSQDSGAEKVKIGTPDAGEEQTNEAEEMAAYVNKVNGGK